MPIAAPRDPLYHQARQHLLHSDNVSVAHLQRRLRIGYQRAIDLRAALEGDAVEYRAGTDSWHIRPDADRVTDFLLEEKLAQAAHLVQNAKALVIAAGAGMGIDSGLPDFRSDEGFWRAYPALGQQQLPFVRIASPYAFQKRPATAWGFYGHRLNLYRAATPHTGFGLLHAWGSACRKAASSSPAMWMGIFRRQVFPRRASTNATAPSTGCNARPTAATESGPRPTCTRKWTRPPASGKANCPTAPAAACWRGPTY